MQFYVLPLQKWHQVMHFSVSNDKAFHLHHLLAFDSKIDYMEKLIYESLRKEFQLELTEKKSDEGTLKIN